MRHGTTVSLREHLLLGSAVILLTFPVPGLAFVGEGERAPEIVAHAWINSAPLSLAGLDGRVVLVEFWTFG